MKLNRFKTKTDEPVKLKIGDDVGDSGVNWAKPVQTVSGDPITIISHHGRGDCCHIGYIGASTELRQWNHKGQILGKSTSDQEGVRDAINVPPCAYVNVYMAADGNVCLAETMQLTAADADAAAFKDTRQRVGRIKVEAGKFDT